MAKEVNSTPDQFFAAKMNWATPPSYLRRPWVPTTEAGLEQTTRPEPYYWKVDTEGKQLPY